MGVTYDAMLDEIVQKIKKDFDDAGQKVVHDRHIGTFSLDDVKKLANRAPKVVTALYDIRPIEMSDNQNLLFSSIAITRGTNRNTEGQDMLNLLNILMHSIGSMDFEWAVDSPEEIHGRSLYTGGLRDTNTNLWSVTWKLKVSSMSIGGAELFKDLPPFDEYIGTLEVGDNTVEESYIGG